MVCETVLYKRREYCKTIFFHETKLKTWASGSGIANGSRGKGGRIER